MQGEEEYPPLTEVSPNKATPNVISEYDADFTHPMNALYLSLVHYLIFIPTLFLSIL